MLLGTTWAQDAHYSNFNAQPLYLNPALIGMHSANWRAGLIYRSQWTAIQAPYRNLGGFIDKSNERLSFGLLLNQNKTSDVGFQRTNILVGAAFKKQLAREQNFLSIGLQLGVDQWRIDVNNLTFDEQYNPDKGYDGELGNNEILEGGTLMLPDINIGVNWRFFKPGDQPVTADIGLAFSHVNTPQASYFNDNRKLPLKTIVYGTLEWQLSKRFGLEPRVFFARQATARELLLGANAVFYIKPQQKFKLGLAQRRQDALILSAALATHNWEFGLAYDVNTSNLREFASNNSAIEFSAVHLFGPQKANPAAPEDRDDDGVIDAEDECPDVPGEVDLKGCPRQTVKTKKTPAATGNDYDGDGILDQNDLCPYEAGEERYQGCNDRDADGIWDHIDACPLLPGKVENYGCPVKIPGIDSDNDGVPDRFDRCIYIKGKEELDGCPDTDNDGISDIKDDCPYLKGIPALNGCPEKEDMTSNIQVDVVEFETDESQILKRYYPMLDRVAYYLKNHPREQVIMEGHTDNEGDHLYNYQLSQRRVQAVREYLILAGAGVDQIQTYFYGETKPKTENGSDYGKARNRRVELKLFR